MSNIVTNKRGPGAPTGRRPVVWVCSAVVNSKLVSEKFVVRDQSPGPETGGLFPREVAEKEFMNKYDTKPEMVIGPFFDKRGAQADKVSKKRLFVDRENLDKYKIEVKRRDAIFGDWKGYSNAIEGTSDLALFLFIGEQNPSGKKRSLPAPGVVNVSDLTFIDNE